MGNFYLFIRVAIFEKTSSMQYTTLYRMFLFKGEFYGKSF
ncbi:hypothetical protein CDIMF43_280006 [Carnobacterium divergens]|nr:hypothetical protein CDIMF43_280006 [Carnobacterium divergens]